MKRLFLLLAALSACNSDSSSDGGSDATVEVLPDLCSTFTAVGQPCEHVSNQNCFPVCEASDPGGCKCVASDAGPVWECSNGSCPSGCVNETCDGGADASDGAPPMTDSGADASDDGAADSAADSPTD